MKERMNEKELLLRMQQGDEAAFEALVRLYEKKIYTLCRRMCGNDEDAQEAAQDAFLALWRSAKSFRGDASLSTWLYRLAANACIDLLRRNQRNGAGGVSLDDEETTLELVDVAPLPEQALERKETQRLIREGLAALPEDYRAILLLREAEGLSYTEIAETMHMELGTVKSRISRGRVLLRNYLTASGNFFDSASSKVTECNREEMSAK